MLLFFSCGHSSRAPIIQKIFFQSKFCGHYSRAAPIQERPLLARVRYLFNVHVCPSSVVRRPSSHRVTSQLQSFMLHGYFTSLCIIQSIFVQSSKFFSCLKACENRQLFKIIGTFSTCFTNSARPVYLFFE